MVASGSAYTPASKISRESRRRASSRRRGIINECPSRLQQPTEGFSVGDDVSILPWVIETVDSLSARRLLVISVRNRSYISMRGYLSRSMKSRNWRRAPLPQDDHFSTNFLIHFNNNRNYLKQSHNRQPKPTNET